MVRSSIDVLKMEKSPVTIDEPNGQEHNSNDESPIEQPQQYTEKVSARDGAHESEAKDVYGDIATAEEYGYVSRG